MSALLLGLPCLGIGAAFILSAVASIRAGEFREGHRRAGRVGRRAVFRDEEPVHFWISMGAALAIGALTCFMGVMFLSTLF